MSGQRSAEDWVKAATRALARHGIDAVRIERLAADMTVTKGSFYWHFKDLAALRTAVLASWEKRATSAVIDRVEASGGSGGDKLLRLAELVFSAEGALERQVRAWAAQDKAAAMVQHRVDMRRSAYVESLFVAAGLAPTDARLRAMLLYQALVGHFTLQRRQALGTDDIRDVVGLLLQAPSAAEKRSLKSPAEGSGT